MAVADGDIAELMAARQTQDTSITHSIACCTAQGPANQHKSLSAYIYGTLGTEDIRISSTKTAMAVLT